MCVGVPKCPRTCKLQNFILFCHLFSRIWNQWLLSNRNICHRFNKHVRIIGPRLKNFTENTTASIIANNTIKQQRSCAMNMSCFGFVVKKCYKTFSFHGNQSKKILLVILRNIILWSIINLYIWYIYIWIQNHVRSLLSYLIQTCKGVLIQRIPIWNHSVRCYPFHISHD